MTWIKNLNNKIGPFLANHQEIPDLFGYYSPEIVSDYQNVYLKKMVPSDNNNIIHQELDLLDSGVESVKIRLNSYDNVNIFDLASTTGDSTLPLIFELLEQEKNVKYIPITANKLLNDFAQKNVLEFSQQPQKNKLETADIRCELEFHDCRSEVLDILKDVDNYTNANLFLLLDSRLGNSLSPFNFLTNIHKSMGQGDYLVLIQSIFRSGTEDMLVADFNNLASQTDSFRPTKDFSKMFSQDPSSTSMIWVEGKSKLEVGSIQCKVKVDSDKTVFGVDFSAGDDVGIFRSSRFERYNLEKMIRSTGFKIMEISFDSNDDNALFFLKKA
jgi:uncharacterized SAM-dependent methyltransferase